MKTVFCVFVLVSSVLITAQGHQSVRIAAPVKMKLQRDQRLFLEGAKAIANGRYLEGRMLLNTMVGTYSDSALIDQARLLIFYSKARDGGQMNEEHRRLLGQIQKVIENDELRTAPYLKPPQ